MSEPPPDTLPPLSTLSSFSDSPASSHLSDTHDAMYTGQPGLLPRLTSDTTRYGLNPQGGGYTYPSRDYVSTDRIKPFAWVKADGEERKRWGSSTTYEDVLERGTFNEHSDRAKLVEGIRSSTDYEKVSLLTL